MPKKITNCFKNKLTFENLLKAHYRARRHKKSHSTNYHRVSRKVERNSLIPAITSIY